MDLRRIRAETPGVEQVLHFESAGASLMPESVVKAMKDYIDREAAVGGYRTQNEYAQKREEAHTEIAKLINARSSEIALSDSATRSWTSLLYSLPLGAGDIVLVPVAEYCSNVIAFMQLEKQRGIELKVIPNDEHGQTSITALKEMITPAVKLISVTHTPTNGGLVNPAEEIGKLAREYDIWYLLDACQTLGQYPVDVEKIKCDFLTATGRKFLRGPRGTGFLYVREKHLEWLEPLMLDIFGANWVTTDSYEMLPTARRFEFWEKNYPGEIGLAAAVKYCNEIGIDDVWARVEPLAALFREKLEVLPGIETCDIGRVRSGIVTFKHDSIAAPEIVSKLKEKMVNLSTTTVFGTRFDMEARGLTEIVRTSVHYYNSEEELDRFCDLLQAMLPQ